MEELLERGRNVLLVAIGGGGDIASTAMIARSLARRGARYVLASIAWERYVIDPIPGPIKLEEILNYLKRGEGYVLVNGSSRALRGGKVVAFQAANASRALGEPVYVVDIYSGVEGYVKALREVMDTTGSEQVIGVDVGGDSLATGCEDNLWSPLADWIGLAALSKLNGVLAIHSPGSDGELDQDYVLSRIDTISSKGGLITVSSMSERDAELLEELLKYVNSEASLIPLLAFRGFRGTYTLRKGSRSVHVSFINTFTFYLLASIAAREVRALHMLAGTRSLHEARGVLNRLGVYTELDLEEDLARLGIEPGSLTAEILLDIRASGIRRLENARRRYCGELGRTLLT